MTIQDWEALVDNVGPFADLSILKGYLQDAPSASKKSRKYSWLQGLIAGREMHEEFGGIDVCG